MRRCRIEKRTQANECDAPGVSSGSEQSHENFNQPADDASDLQRCELLLKRRGNEPQVSALNHHQTGPCLSCHGQGIHVIDL